MAVRNRMRVLLAQKEHAEQRKITYEEISGESGIPISTLSSIMNNTAKSYKVEAIEALLDFLDCKIEDFFEVVLDGEVQKRPLSISREFAAPMIAPAG